MSDLVMDDRTYLPLCDLPLFKLPTLSIVQQLLTTAGYFIAQTVYHEVVTAIRQDKLNSQFIVTTRMDFQNSDHNTGDYSAWSPPPLLDLKCSDRRVWPMQL